MFIQIFFGCLLCPKDYFALSLFSLFVKFPLYLATTSFYYSRIGGIGLLAITSYAFFTNFLLYSIIRSKIRKRVQGIERMRQLFNFV
jgi:hypothetical protein